MPREKSKLEKELEGIGKRLQASKKSLHDTELRTEDLGATIKTAFDEQERRKQKRR